jgi:hypothetical protein
LTDRIPPQIVFDAGANVLGEKVAAADAER